MQNFNHEFHRSIVVVVKDYLEMAGLGVNIGHGISCPLISYSFRHIASRSPFKFRTKQEQSHYPACKNLRVGARRKRAFARHAWRWRAIARGNTRSGESCLAGHRGSAPSLPPWAIADSSTYGHGKLNVRRALTPPANASEGANLRATSPARRCLASRLCSKPADELLRSARIRRRRDDPCRYRRC